MFLYEYSKENDVTLWQWSDDGQNNEKPQEPQLLASFDHSFGDVNEIQFLEHESGKQIMLIHFSLTLLIFFSLSCRKTFGGII